MLYSLGTLMWVGSLEWRDGYNAAFWFLLIPVLFQLWRDLRRNNRLRARLLMWALVITLIPGAGLSTNNSWPGTWIILYPAMLAALWALGRLYAEELRWSPLPWAPRIGLCITALIMSFAESWHNYAGRNLSWDPNPGHTFNLLVNGIVILVMLSALVLLFTRRPDLFSIQEWAEPALPFLALLSRGLLESSPASDGLLAGVFNVFVLVWGITNVVGGLREVRWAALNFGLLAICGLLAVRFFDSDMTFLTRGVLFVLLGAAFLGANLYLSARRKSMGGAAI